MSRSHLRAILLFVTTLSAACANIAGIADLEVDAGSAKDTSAGETAAEDSDSADTDVTENDGDEDTSCAAKRDPGECPTDMRAIRGGCTNGASGDEPVIDGFCMDVTEVTMGAYGTCVLAGDCAPPAMVVTKQAGMTDAQVKDASSFCNANDATKVDHPVNCITWLDADSFCKKRGKTLPSVSQWGWAAQGEERELLYPWGSDAPAGLPCWSGLLHHNGTCVVGSHPASDAKDVGVHDLAGNVWEYMATPGPTELGAATYRLKGGSWATTTAMLLSRDAITAWNPATRITNDIGFRCVR